MANKKKYKLYSKKTGCPEPVGILVDIAGAAAMRAIAKKKLKRDIEKGCGEESAEAALAVFGAGAMRGGSTGLVNLGGLYGIKSALEDIEKDQTTTHANTNRTRSVQIDDIVIKEYKPINNEYAWRLNCADAGEYGIYPEDYETREEYNQAIAKAVRSEIFNGIKDDSKSEAVLQKEENVSDTCVFCKVSCLEDGTNKYYILEDLTLKIGDLVFVPDGKGNIKKGIIISVEQFTNMTAPQTIGITEKIIKKVES